MALNRDQLLAALIPAAIVKPIAGVGDVRIKPITEAQFTALGDVKGMASDVFLARIAVLSLVDDGDVPLLTEEDIPALLGGAFGPVQAIFGVVSDVNGLGGRAKNSEATPVADSSSV